MSADINNLDSQTLAEQKQQRELMELAEKFNNLAEQMFKLAVDDGLTIKQMNVFFNKHLSLLWGGKLDKFLANQKSKNVL